MCDSRWYSVAVVTKGIAIALLLSVLSWTFGTGDLALAPQQAEAAAFCASPEPVNDDHDDAADPEQPDHEAACSDTDAPVHAEARLIHAQQPGLPDSFVPLVHVPPPTA